MTRQNAARQDRGENRVRFNLPERPAGCFAQIEPDSFFVLPRADGSSPVPLYLQVRAILTDAIRKGVLAPGSQLPSTTRLARQLRVSLLTAHRGLQYLAEEGWILRGRGHRTYVRADYQAALAHSPRFRICLAARRRAGWHETGIGNCVAGLQEAAAQITPPTERILVHYESADELTHVKADGFVCVQPAVEDVPALEQIARSKSLVVMGSLPSGTRLHGIDVEHEDGARAAVRHLAELGHRRIAMVVGCRQDLAWTRRLAGLTLEMGSHGLTAGETGPLRDSDSCRADRLEKQLARLLKSRQAPTAMIAGDLRVALRVAGHVQRMGLAIPRDLSLVGFGDDWFAGLLNPPLTVVADPVREMTRLALSRLLQLLTGRPAAKTGPLPARLMVRGSTAPPGEPAQRTESETKSIGSSQRRRSQV